MNKEFTYTSFTEQKTYKMLAKIKHGSNIPLSYNRLYKEKNMEESRIAKTLNNKSIGFRLFIICVLILCLNIPLGMVKSVMYGRSGMYNTAMNDIASAWGGSQTVIAPIVTIPVKYTKVSSVWNGQTKSYEQIEKEEEDYVRILPDNLNIETEIFPEIRHRGIFEVLVYKADMKISGKFGNLHDIDIDSKYNAEWDKAFVSLGLDPAAIRGEPKFFFGNRKTELEPGSRIRDLQGVSAPVAINGEDGAAFSIDLQFNGSGMLSLAPVGKMNNFTISSKWPHPTFSGVFRPDAPKIEEDGFSAEWRIPSLARDYPQKFMGDGDIRKIKQKTASLTLYETMPIYKKSLRLADYGIMFITLTFVMMFLFEQRLNRKLHYVQYAIVGLAVSLFFLTVISLSEHIDFAYAYAAASLLVTVMTSCYLFGALRNRNIALSGGLLMAFLYTVLYMMLSEADYALLIGTLILAITLSMVMWATRNINFSNE